MSEEKSKRKCHWCPKDAERVDYREVDGMTSKIVTCSECFEISTEHLIKLQNEQRIKKQAIDTISSLYPSDSEFSSVNDIGKEFMLESMEEVGFNWRELPQAVLVRWAEKCEIRERNENGKMNDKYGK